MATHTQPPQGGSQHLCHRKTSELSTLPVASSSSPSLSSTHCLCAATNNLPGAKPRGHTSVFVSRNTCCFFSVSLCQPSTLRCLTSASPNAPDPTGNHSLPPPPKPLPLQVLCIQSTAPPPPRPHLQPGPLSASPRSSRPVGSSSKAGSEPIHSTPSPLLPPSFKPRPSPSWTIQTDLPSPTHSSN